MWMEPATVPPVDGARDRAALEPELGGGGVVADRALHLGVRIARRAELADPGFGFGRFAHLILPVFLA
jgi:hypothetical protein